MHGLLRSSLLLAGTPRFSARSPWAPLPALCATLAILATGLLAGQTLAAAVAAAADAPGAPGGLPREGAAVLFLIGLQGTIILAVLALVGTGARPAREVLALETAGGVRIYLEALLCCLLLVAAYNALAYLSGFSDLVGDLKPFAALLRSPYAVAASIALVLGAPLSEELLFRGFLLPALARSRLRFRGAALLTTLAWTALHVGYSASGLVEVTMMGLFFSWLLWRSGSLRVPLACHIAVNATMLVLILLFMR